VKVVLTGQNGQCTVKTISIPDVEASDQASTLERYIVEAHLGETVEWEFQNDCDSPLVLKVDRFSVDDEIAGRLADAPGASEKGITRKSVKHEEHHDPLEPSYDRRVSVDPGKSGKVTCKVKPDAYYPRTYKYDILRLKGNGSWSVILDPEIEIYK
jgi:hypothetical protein